MSEEIHVLDHKVRLLQPEEGFRTSMDSVLLAAACPANKNQSVLDLGCGVGGAALCLLHREPDLRLTGLDIHHDYLDLARQNAALNHREGTWLPGNVSEYRASEPDLRYHHIICNPPFFNKGAHTPSPSGPLATARSHDTGIEDWINCAFDNLRPKGSLNLIYPSADLHRVIQALGRRFGDTSIIPLYTKSGQPAKRFVLATWKDRRGDTVIQPPVILKDHKGEDTQQAHYLLRKGGSFATLWQKRFEDL